MALKLMYITNDIMVAKVAEESGVDRIWIDLEWMGKEARQPGMNTVKSDHKVTDVAKLRPYISKSELMVRVNPLHVHSTEEIDAVVDGGADLIMLPFFHTADDARKFIEMVAGRTKTMLLVETKEAYENLDEIVKVPGVDEIHIGLNDLHLSYNMTFMFEPLANGMVEKASKIIRNAGIPYGFGGIARLGQGLLPAEHIIAEHYRLESTMAILSRTFCDTWTDKNEDTLKEVFGQGVKEIREYENEMMACNREYLDENRKKVKEKVNQIVAVIEKKRIESNLKLANIK